MDVLFISASFGAAYTFLRTTCEATVSQAAFALTTGFILVSMLYIQL